MTYQELQQAADTLKSLGETFTRHFMDTQFDIETEDAKNKAAFAIANTAEIIALNLKQKLSPDVSFPDKAQA